MPTKPRRTELLPVPKAAALFTAALDVLNDADRVPDIRDELEQDWSARRGRIGRKQMGRMRQTGGSDGRGLQGRVRI